MTQCTHSQLSSQDRRVLNLLEIKMYDIAQNVQLVGKQLTNNQIKDTIANSYSIFCQLRHFFQNSGVIYLYQIMRKMQVNSVALSSLLTERLDRIDKKIDHAKQKNTDPEVIPVLAPNEVIENDNQIGSKPKIHKLGGISLYNQSYLRGLEYYQVDSMQPLEPINGKCRIKLTKKAKDVFLSSIYQQLQQKAEVQIQTIADQIKKYIKDYKQNSKITNCVSYQKELTQIIDFFKTSQIQAMSFLNKSPKTLEYTEDYINRINNLETELKTKEKSQKLNINEKLKYFISNLRQKLHDMEQRYHQKTIKLQLYQESLKKQTVNNSTQTYDGVESRLKSQQLTIKQLQQRYKILSDIKNKQINFQSKYYQIFHQINIKNAEISKSKNTCIQLQSQIQFLKKIIRDNKQKINFDMREIDKRRNKKKNTTEKIKTQVDESNQAHKDSPQLKFDQTRRSTKVQKKSRRLQRVASQNSNFFKAHQFTELSRELSQIGKQDNDQIQIQPKKSTFLSPLALNQKKQSYFKNQNKKNSKRDEQRQVFFKQKSKQHINSTIYDDIQNNSTPLSIDRIKNEDEQQEDNQPKQSKRSSPKQYISSSVAFSMRSFEGGENKKSSKSISKKCIILKDNSQKDKNLLAAVIKFQKFKITANDVMSMTIHSNVVFPQSTTISIYPKKQRPSYPQLNEQFIRQTSKKQLNLNDFSKNRQNIQSTHLNKKVRPLLEAQKSLLKSIIINKASRKNIECQDQSQYRNNLIEESQSQHRRTQPSNLIKNGSLSKSGGKNESCQQDKYNKMIDEPQICQQKKGKPHYAGLQKNKKFNNSSEKRNYKDMSTNLQSTNKKNREVSLFQKLKEQKWSFAENTQQSTLFNYIVEEISKQQLNLQEFKQIINCINENQNSQSFIQQNQNRNSQNKQSVFSEIKKNQSHKELKLNSKKTSSNKYKIQLSQLNSIKEQKQNSYILRPDQIFGLGQRVFLNIRQIHKKMSQCHNIENQPCEHMKKYLSILKKINEMGNPKSSFKLHIQKIGQLLQQNLQNSLKKSPQYLKNMSKLQNICNKINKQNNIKNNVPNMDQTLEQERNRILPIINSTSSSYYKPKGKQFTIK